tara:strand:+ start:8586 stop:10157 length:1572 start_codon:yes stop_codon:yes gene_type:complete
MTRLSLWLSGLTGWRRYALAWLLGAVLSLSLPPLYIWPALLVGFTGILWILDGCSDRRSAFGVGWCFGFGYIGLSLYWISSALLIEPDRTGWMIPFAVLGLPAFFAFWVGLATLVVRLLNISGAARVLLFAGAWCAAEWLRGHAFTGFPWNLIGYAAAGSDALLQATALVGIYGLGFLVVLAAAIPATLAGGAEDISRARRYGPAVLVLVGIAMIWLGGTVRLLVAHDEIVPDVTLRLVQANISQHHKWQEERRRANLARYFQLSSQSGSEDVTHIIWPETAVPYFLAADPDLSRAIGRLVKPGGMVITGAPRTTTWRERPLRVWNAVHAIDHDGQISGTYDKSHLLPFGEYVPLRPLLRRLGVEKITSGQGDFQAGVGKTTIEMPGIPPLGILICYEAIFPGEVVSTASRPAWLLNVTNDAWFGHTAGPHQHFTMSRVRAVEEGLPIVRVANTGISGVADSYGRIIVRSDLGEVRVIDVSLPAALTELTPYARWGDAGILAVLMVVAVYTAALKAPRIARKE